MNYSICYLDDGGRTQRSEVLPFDDDATALQYARNELHGAPLVEVWKNYLLVARLNRKPIVGSQVAWENEGGALIAHANSGAGPGRLS